MRKTFCQSGLYPDAAAVCDVCLGEIYMDDELYIIDGFYVCTDCFGAYAEEYFEPNKAHGYDLGRN